MNEHSARDKKVEKEDLRKHQIGITAQDPVKIMGE